MSVLPCPADQLQRATERQEYAEAAHLLEAVQQLAGHFQSYVQIPKVGPCTCSCLAHALVVGAAVHRKVLSAAAWLWWCLDRRSHGPPTHVATIDFK